MTIIKWIEYTQLKMKREVRWHHNTFNFYIFWHAEQVLLDDSVYSSFIKIQANIPNVAF